MKNKIFYQAITQFENTGDLLINKSLLELIEGYGDLIINDVGVPVWYLQDLGVTAQSRLSNKTNSSFTIYLIKRVFKAAFNKEETVYLISGPGHFYGNSLKKTVKNYISGLLFAFLKILGCRIIKCGISLGPLSPRLGASEVFRSKFYRNYFIRDTLSLNLAKHIGIRNYQYMPDLAWAYKAESTQDFQSSGKNDSISVFLSFRESVIEEQDSKGLYLKSLISSLHLLLQQLTASGKQIKLAIGYQVDRDKKVCEILYREFNESYDVTYRYNRLGINDAELVYRDIDFVLSNRLHVLLFASKYDTVPICVTDVEKHVKIKGIFEDSDLQDLLIDITEKDGEQLNKLNNIVRSKGEILERIAYKDISYTKQMKQLIKSVFD